MIKLSVIIPIYNSESVLKFCVNSILHQPLRSLELILVNDGSMDGSLAICYDMAVIDERIHIIDKGNGGVSSARNVGIEHAQGEYITFVDADDYIEADTFTEVVFQSNADVIEFPYSGMPGHKPYEIGRYSKNSNEIYLQMTTFMHNPCWARLYKRAVIGDIRFKEDIRMGEDILFLVQLFPHINSYHLIPGLHGYVYDNDNPLSAMHVNSKSDNLDSLNAVILYEAQQNDNRLAWFYVIRHCLVFSLRYHMLSTLLPKILWSKLLLASIPLKDKKDLAVCKINYILGRIS